MWLAPSRCYRSPTFADLGPVQLRCRSGLLLCVTHLLRPSCPPSKDLSLCQTHSDKPGSSPHLKILNIIMSANSLLPCELTLTGSRDEAMSIFGAIIHPTTCRIQDELESKRGNHEPSLTPQISHWSLEEGTPFRPWPWVRPL